MTTRTAGRCIPAFNGDTESPRWHPTAVVGSPPEHAAWIGDCDDVASAAHDWYSPCVSARARLSAFVTIDAGTRHHTFVGDDVLLLAHAHIGHDAQIFARVHVCTGAIIGGHAIIEEDAHIGIGAVVLPWRRVGTGARVGSGAVVTSDVPAGAVVAGSPARIVEQNPLPFTGRRSATKRAEFPPMRKEFP